MAISFKAPVYDTVAVGGSDRLPFSGTPGQILDDVETYAKLGVSELVIDFRSDDLLASLERMERFAADIMHAAR